MWTRSLSGWIFILINICPVSWKRGLNFSFLFGTATGASYRNNIAKAVCVLIAMPTRFAVDSSTEARAPWRSWLEQEILISCQWCSSVVERVQVVPMFEPVGDWVYLSHQTRRTTGHRQSCDNFIEGQPLPEPIRLAQAQMFKRVFCIFWYQHKFRCYTITPELMLVPENTRYSSLYKLHFTTSFPVDRMGDGDGILRVCIIEVNGWTNEYDVPCSQWPTPASLALDKYQDQAWQATKFPGTMHRCRL